MARKRYSVPLATPRSRAISLLARPFWSCFRIHAAFRLQRGGPVAVLCDDPERLSSSGADALWGIFTRIDPAHDVRGVGESVEAKHWGCEGPLLLDARSKPHHAPELVPDEKAEERVDRLFAPGGPFHGM